MSEKTQAPKKYNASDLNRENWSITQYLSFMSYEWVHSRFKQYKNLPIPSHQVRKKEVWSSLMFEEIKSYD